VAHNPIIWSATSAADFDGYFARCESIADAIAAALRRIHECGYAYVDLSPHNVLVAEDDTPRLVDFEAVIPLDGTGRFETLGTPGHAPHRRMYFADRADYDAYGLAMLALFLIAPLNETVERNPAVLAHLRDLVARHTKVPSRLWARATSFHRAAAAEFTRAPGPHEVAADPGRHLAALREKLVAGLLAVVDPAGRDVFPLGPGRYLSNELCVAHGVAGVVHALRFAGAPPIDPVVDRLAADALSQGQSLPPGLHSGLAGIAWVLADADRPAEAVKLLELADAHPVLREDGPGTATLGHGHAGLGLAHLALYRHTGDAHHVEQACAHAAVLPAADAIRGALGGGGANGLLHGPSGVALFYYYLGLLTGDDGRLDDGLRLVRADIERMRAADGGLLLAVSDRDRRLMPYLYAGTAGALFVASRYLAVRGDDHLSAALPAMRAAATCPFTAYPGLYSGAAGLGLVLADHARRHGDAHAAREADLVGRRMFLHAVARGDGAHVLGEHALRLSTDLSFGSAGVLLFLAYLRDARPDPFFTLDGLATTEGR
jgi:hypothetical protein